MVINKQNSLTLSLKYIRIDGLPNILLSNLFVAKFAWLFVMLFTVCFCFYLIARSVAEYVEYGVNTRVRLKSQINLTFPTVIMCSLNPLNSQYYVQLLNEANITFIPDSYDSFLELEWFNKQKTGAYFTPDQKKAMFDFEGFVISCSFKNKPCNASQLRYAFFPWYLNCIQFNSGYDNYENSVPISEVSFGGEKNALTLELYVGLPDELTQMLTQRGVYVFLIDTNDDPFKNSPSAMILSPGYVTRLSVKKNVYSQFNEWPYLYSTCNVNADGTLMQPIKDSTFFDHALSTNFTYSQDSCLLYCFQHYNFHKCGCVAQWVNYHINASYHKCLTPEEIDCSTQFYFDEFNIGDFIKENCLNKCPLECNLHRYDNYQSISALPDPVSEEKRLKANPSLVSRYSNQTDFSMNLLSNVVKFSIFYDTMSYTEVKEEAKITGATLLASLGGYFHLFLGMSCISFVEVIEIVLQLTYSFHHNKQKIFFMVET